MTPLEIARESWGRDLPDWVEALAIECGRSSQAKVAARLGRSGAMISQILRRKYPADLSAIEARFRGVFQDLRVTCPALGDIPVDACQDWRAKGRQFVPTNSLRARMFRACLSCPRTQEGSE